MSPRGGCGGAAAAQQELCSPSPRCPQAQPPAEAAADPAGIARQRRVGGRSRPNAAHSHGGQGVVRDQPPLVYVPPAPASSPGRDIQSGAGDGSHSNSTVQFLSFWQNQRYSL